jgi:hypothetical protein
MQLISWYNQHDWREMWRKKLIQFTMHTQNTWVQLYHHRLQYKAGKLHHLLHHFYTDFQSVRDKTKGMLILQDSPTQHGSHLHQNQASVQVGLACVSTSLHWVQEDLLEFSTSCVLPVCYLWVICISTAVWSRLNDLTATCLTKKNWYLLC